jgi:3-oxoacyl-[acyl-carrier-protein] synthase III
MIVSRFNSIKIKGLAVTLPRNRVKTESLRPVLGNTVIDNFLSKTGIQSTPVSIEDQTASDLGFVSAQNLLDRHSIISSEIGILVFLTRTPDYRNPVSSAILQHRLKLLSDCLVYDINLGNTGFVYGLQLGCSLLESMSVRYALIVIGDTPSKLFTDNDPERLGYGDGAAAMLLEKVDSANPVSVITLTDSTEFNSYIQREGGFRMPGEIILNGRTLSADDELYKKLIINRSAYYSFVRKNICTLMQGIFKTSGKDADSWDCMVLQQETEELTDELKEICGFSAQKVPGFNKNLGNTGGASIPLSLSELAQNNSPGNLQILACSFGEGFSMGMADFCIQTEDILPLSESDEYFNQENACHEL